MSHEHIVLEMNNLQLTFSGWQARFSADTFLPLPAKIIHSTSAPTPPWQLKKNSLGGGGGERAKTIEEPGSCEALQCSEMEKSFLEPKQDLASGDLPQGNLHLHWGFISFCPFGLFLHDSPGRGP